MLYEGASVGCQRGGSAVLGEKIDPGGVLLQHWSRQSREHLAEMRIQTFAAKGLGFFDAVCVCGVCLCWLVVVAMLLLSCEDSSRRFVV